LKKIINTKDASVKTVSIEVKQLVVSNRKLTLSVFRQIPEVPEDEFLTFGENQYNGIPWGHVNYFWGNEKDFESPKFVRHILWQNNFNELRRSIIDTSEYISDWFKPVVDELKSKRWEVKLTLECFENILLYKYDIFKKARQKVYVKITNENYATVSRVLESLDESLYHVQLEDFQTKMINELAVFRHKCERSKGKLDPNTSFYLNDTGHITGHDYIMEKICLHYPDEMKKIKQITVDDVVRRLDEIYLIWDKCRKHYNKLTKDLRKVDQLFIAI
jgi:hypothetical protein